MRHFPLVRVISSYILLIVLIIPTIGVSSTQSKGSDLTIESIAIPKNIKEGSNIIINATVKNVGDKDISGNIEIALYIDNNLVDIENITNGLRKEIGKNVSFYWTAIYGDHVVRVSADYRNRITESNEKNNDISVYINVAKLPTDLVVKNVDLPSVVNVGDMLDVNVTVENRGHAVDKVNVSLTIDSCTYTNSIDSISIYERKNISFVWHPKKIGYYNVTVSIVPHTDELNISNNVWSGKVLVNGFFAWWNSSWHYRFVVLPRNGGLVSEQINFTDMLEQLNLSNKTFDCNSIRVIRYNSNTSMENISYKFNKSKSYNATTNADGFLSWNSTGNSFYMIYFDVLDNGVKENDSVNIYRSNASQSLYVGKPEGWRFNILSPVDNIIYSVNDTVNITIKSLASLSSVSGYLYHNNNYVGHMFFNRTNNVTWSSKYTVNDEGSWSVRIRAYDAAGYFYEKSIYFYTEKCDIKILDLNATNVYEKSKSDVICKLTSTAPISNVTIVLYEEDSIIGEKNISIDNPLRNVSVEFLWYPDSIGKRNLTAVVDPNNKIPEKNDSNNRITISVNVKGLPDLMIDNLVVPDNIKEGEPVYIYAHIGNIGHSSANEYKVALYLSKDTMKWIKSEEVDVSDVNVSISDEANVSLTWNSASYGEDGVWIVGVEVLTDNQKKDLNIENNRKNSIIRVTPVEKNPPVISDVRCYPISQQIGLPVTIYANITDDTGVSKSTLTILYPDNNTKTFDMKRMGTNTWMHRFKIKDTIGRYRYYITALDSSSIRNEIKSPEKSFNITGDIRPPDILDIWRYPNLSQIVGGNVNISCIVSDNVGIKKVNITVIDPSGNETEYDMEKLDNNTYYLDREYNKSGRYSFFISAEDYSNNSRYSDLYDIWITSNINDTDGDSIPDWWETRYGLNPYSPEDASGDADGDGINEIEEYKEGLNPLKPNTIFGLSQSEFAVTVVVVFLLIIVAVVSLSTIRRD